ncbi:MAG: hypothetical protein PHC75_05210 [Burkholderiales bacterium]|nr:hypothetical protein [Burkholderiales bacterium]
MKLNKVLENYIGLCRSFKIGQTAIILDEKLKCHYLSNDLLELGFVKNFNNLSASSPNIAKELKNVCQQIIDKQLHHINLIATLALKDRAVVTELAINTLKDPDSKVIVGLVIVCWERLSTNPVLPLFNSTVFKDQELILISNSMKMFEFPPSLTDHDHMILVLLSLYKTHQEIASILSQIYGKTISKSNISSHISRKLFPLFGVINSSELINRVSGGGILYYIPQTLYSFLSQNKDHLIK